MTFPPLAAAAPIPVKHQIDKWLISTFLEKSLTRPCESVISMFIERKNHASDRQSPSRTLAGLDGTAPGALLRGRHPLGELPLMDMSAALVALGALAQEHRLALFRLLVQAGADGLTAGAIAEKLGIPNSSLSFHLAQLRGAGLISQERQHRSLIYRANYAAMNGLVDYLTENCCVGSECLPQTLSLQSQAKRKSA